MKRTLTLLFLALLSLSLSASFDAKESDYRFYITASYAEDQKLLEEALKSASADEKYEILWRLSRDQLTITDHRADGLSKDEKIAEYSKSEELADQALSVKEGPDAYHWKASAIGRIGQANGPMNSLKKAKPMRNLVEKVQNDYAADRSDSWYVLGLLYNQLPGSISFGDKDAAISYMRRCLDTQDNENRSNLTNYLELANQLWDRDDSAKKRAKAFEKMKKDYEKESLPTEKMKYYEGAMEQPFYLDTPLLKLSDREEAVRILEYGLANYEKRSNKLEDDRKLAAECQKRLSEMRDKL